MNRRRLAALIALSKDPAASFHERQLAARRAAEIQAQLDDGAEYLRSDYVETEFEVDDELVAALDRAMARAATVASPKYRAARAAQSRAGFEATKRWQDGRGKGLPR